MALSKESVVLIYDSLGLVPMNVSGSRSHLAPPRGYKEKQLALPKGYRIVGLAF